MMSVMEPIMEVESSRSYIDELYSPDATRCMDAIVRLKNSVIGSNRQKGSVIQQGVVPRLLQLLGDNVSSNAVKIEATITLGSLAKGTEEHVKALVDTGIVPLLINTLYSDDQNLVEVCLCCLRTVFQSPCAPVDLIYDDPSLVTHLLNLLSHSVSNQMCITTVLTAACKTPENQNTLCERGAVPALAALLCSPHYKVQMPSLSCLANMCFQNANVSSVVSISSYGGKSVPDLLVTLMARDKPSEMQMGAARCLTYMHRAGAISAEDTKILYKTLPCLVRLCKKDRPPSERVLAAETLAYLTEVDTELQRLASISNHLVLTLAEFLRHPGARGLSNSSSGGSASSPPPPPSISIPSIPPIPPPPPAAAPLDPLSDPLAVHHFSSPHSSSPSFLMSGSPAGMAAAAANAVRLEKEAQDMKQAAFRAFASLGANDEDIRKKIIDTDNLMEHIVAGLQDSSPKVRLAAVRCLHSLSRSVQQLRTTFQDHTVWRPLMQLLQGAGEDVLSVASSTLCNLLLEFSPSKEPILESGAVNLLCQLTRREDPALRLNGIWALMNMAFQAEQKIKSQILNTLGTDQIFRLLSDPEVNVLMKTLGLLRNLLSTKPHIDHIMSLHGNQIMQAVILILEGNHGAEVKEQALCILANIADGDSAKEFIMSNEDVLKKLTNYMMHSSVKLQIAAIFCISNLVWKEEGGAAERQARLRDMGVYKLLQQLIVTNDTMLFDKVKTAMTQFSES
ncbi:armadillo repeat-containing protein 8-like isoform X2 [Ischnura elegans]|uniref:armadillo repeat-containing protein 8-like isoform X2 n=1 Tax=Ischnura elegans TaxID=197161 RepID=UPI001ED86DC0|nr:armadillo repeat-containing protein 8-like isoform X2 [Ischnura elegans]